MILSFHNCSVINKCGKKADNVLNCAMFPPQCQWLAGRGQCELYQESAASNWRAEAEEAGRDSAGDKPGCVNNVRPVSCPQPASTQPINIRTLLLSTYNL